MTSVAKIYGLVLAGGKSTRMGKDKGLIAYHGMPQREYLYRMLGKVCDTVFMSVRKDQVGAMDPKFKTVVDEDIFKGPFNGILSAHKAYPEVAWLVLACDLPLFDEKALRDLIGQRKPTSIATSYALRENPLPEPLCAIWEPNGLSAAVSYMTEGLNGSCPRKFLINNDTHLVYPENENVLMNANSESEYEEALAKLT